VPICEQVPVTPGRKVVSKLSMWLVEAAEADKESLLSDRLA